MAVLTLRLAGPMQSWGTGSRFTRRTTDDMPSKSGVIGLLAAARGVRRTDPLGELLKLRFGVRADSRGELLRDFQTAYNPGRDSRMPLSERFYRSDAVYLAAVAGERELLAGLEEAIRSPEFLLYLGRRSCPPAGPVRTGLHPEAGDVEEVLKDAPWQVSGWRAERAGPTVACEIVVDAGENEDGDLVRDVPVSYDPEHRKYEWRRVRRFAWTVPNPAGEHRDVSPSAVHDNDHDPMAALE